MFSSRLWCLLRECAPEDELERQALKDPKAFTLTVDTTAEQTESNPVSAYWNPPLSLLAASIIMLEDKSSLWLIRQPYHEFDLNEKMIRAITRDEPKSLLEVAIEKGSVEVVQMLVLKGADLMRENTREQIPLEYARRVLKDSGHPIVKLLKEHTLASRRPWRHVKANHKQAFSDASFLLKPDNPIVGDVKITVQGDKEIICHSAILAQRSPYFKKALIDTPMQEAQNKCIDLSDVNEPDMLWIINGIYRGCSVSLPGAHKPAASPSKPVHKKKLHQQQPAASHTSQGPGQQGQDSTNASRSSGGDNLGIRLLRLADRFDVGFLMDGLEDEISECLDPSNVLDILAQGCHNDNLSRACNDYVFRNLSEVAHDPGTEHEERFRLFLAAIRQAGPFVCTRVSAAVARGKSN